MRDAFALVKLIDALLDRGEEFNAFRDLIDGDSIGQFPDGFQDKLFLGHESSMPMISAEHKNEGGRETSNAEKTLGGGLPNVEWQRNFSMAIRSMEGRPLWRRDCSRVRCWAGRRPSLQGTARGAGNVEPRTPNVERRT